MGIFPYCALLVVVAYTMIVMLYLYSSGELVVEYGVRKFVFNETTQNYLWFNLFALLWGMNFITDFGNCVLAWATTSWYFTKAPQDDNGDYVRPSCREVADPDDPEEEKHSTFSSAPLCNAVANTFCHSRNHSVWVIRHRRRAVHPRCSPVHPEAGRVRQQQGDGHDRQVPAVLHGLRGELHEVHH